VAGNWREGEKIGARNTLMKARPLRDVEPQDRENYLDWN